jgi:hypothetical protein
MAVMIPFFFSIVYCKYFNLTLKCTIDKNTEQIEETHMQFRFLIFIFMLFGLSIESFATTSMAEPGSKQFVVIMNSLSNPVAPDLNKTNVMVRYYDGTGNHPPCWTENNIKYHSDPVVAGAGGKNGCGGEGTSPQAIVKIDILPLRTSAGIVYKELPSVMIDPNKFYTNILIQQGIAPVFNPNGTLKSLGTIKLKKVSE